MFIHGLPSVWHADSLPKGNVSPSSQPQMKNCWKHFTSWLGFVGLYTSLDPHIRTHSVQRQSLLKGSLLWPGWLANLSSDTSTGVGPFRMPCLMDDGQVGFTCSSHQSQAMHEMGIYRSPTSPWKHKAEFPYITTVTTGSDIRMQSRRLLGSMYCISQAELYVAIGNYILGNKSPPTIII